MTPARRPGAEPTAGRLHARYRRILRFAIPYILQEWWFELFLPRIGLARVGRRGRVARFQRIARNFHGLAVELGGLMIKVGQFLSSRLDVLPPIITDELKSLQDEVPPVPFGPIRAQAEAELGLPLHRAYASFDETPVAAASLGQVHRARLRPEDARETGFADVVVKVQRPGIRDVIDVDLAALHRIAGWLSHVAFIRQRVDLIALLQEFAAVTLQEVDYLHEAASAERLLQAFADDDRLDGPQTVWERTTRRVLTLSDVTAIKIDDTAALREAGINPAQVADALAGVMLDQLFTQGFFHADPHPGNVFVTPRRDADATPRQEAARPWTLTFVDFGMMGEIPDTLRRGLQRGLVAIATRDGTGLVAAMRDTGMLLPSADGAQLGQTLSELFDRFGGMAVADLQHVDPHELQDFARRFGEVLRGTPIQLPKDLLFVIRAVSVMSGVCTSLNPQFNIWKAVDPYAAGLAREHGGNALRALAQQAWALVRDTARLPGRIDDLVSLLEAGPHPASPPPAPERRGGRVASAVVFAALLLGGILLLHTATALGIVLMAASAAPLLHAVLGAFRRPR